MIDVQRPLLFPLVAMAEEHKRPGVLSDFILGCQDGMVNVLGVILGVAIASQDFRIILAGGLAATFAESISMGAVAYTSTNAKREHYLAELEREKREMKELPKQELQEIDTILQRWGFIGQELEEMRERIVAKPAAMLEIMMSFELFLAPVPKRQALKSAALVGTSALVGSLVPLIPFLLLQHEIFVGILVSLVISGVLLFMIGWYSSKVTVGRPVKGGVQMAAIGIASALAGFAIALLVSH
jgi:vacuolar iron transporter family protein